MHNWNVSLSFSPRCLAKPDISFYTGFTGIDSNYMNVYEHPPRKLPLVSREGPLGFDLKETIRENDNWHINRRKRKIVFKKMVEWIKTTW